MDGSAAKNNPRADKRAWAFMVERMPRTVARIKEARAAGLGAHVDACWRAGVLDLRPGWFWAYEAGVSVGVPDATWVGDPVVQALLRDQPELSVFMLKDKPAETEVSGGAH